MTAITQERVPGDFIISESSFRFRQNLTILAGQVLEIGAVLSYTYTPGSVPKYRLLDPTASDGSQNADAVLYEAVDASGGEVEAVGLRSFCEVNQHQLGFPPGITPEQKANAIAQLTARGVVVR